MLLLILGILALVAGFVTTSSINAMSRREWERRKSEAERYNRSFSETYEKISFPAYIGTVVAIILIVVSCIAVVPTGYTGILTTFGRVEERTIASGANVIAPWQKVIRMDNRTQKVQIETAAFSSDIQQVDIQMSLNYCIDQATAQNLYRTVGKNYYDNVIYPRVLENTKAVFSQYTAEELISSREYLSGQVVEQTSDDMRSYGVNIISIAIEDIDFTDAFTSAVEAKQVAAQNKLTAETQQAQKTMEQEAEAERAIISANAKAQQDIIAAQADLEVVKIQADAALYAGEREANMNERIAAALSPELINYYWIKQWDGKLPTTVLGNDSSYMIDLTGAGE